MGFRHVIASCLLLATTSPADAIQFIRGTLVDAGGNGGQYGIFSLRGPASRVQSGACGRTSLGEIPTGITECTSSFNNASVPSEWQAGDVIIARAPATFSTDIPFDLRTGGVYLCQVAFEGWSGPCTGKTGGVFNPGGVAPFVYECQFTLPVSGDVTIGAAFSGADFNGNPCPAIASSATTTTTVPATPTTTLPGTPPNPLDPLVDALTDDLLNDIRRARDFYDWLRKNPGLGFALPPRPNKGSLVADLSALNGAAGTPQTAGTAGAAPTAGQRVVLARGKAKLPKAGGSGTLRLKTTRPGRKLLKTGDLADLQLGVGVKTKQDGAVSRLVPVSLESLMPAMGR